jgi:O-acetylhomoserine/O-acetylserine sulfhydrylase-like pyridoxal-dependent enzyme
MKIAHDHGIPLVVDNTFGLSGMVHFCWFNDLLSTFLGFLVKPIDLGADIIGTSSFILVPF